MGSPSEAQKATEQFRNLLDREATAQSREMVRNYAPVYQRLQKDTNDLVRIAQSRGLKPWQVMRMDRMKDLESQYLRNVDRWAKASGETITQAQRNAVGLSRRSAKAVVTAGLPDGVNMNNLARLGIGWNELPEDAFANFVGISQDGAPVGRLLAGLGPDSAPKIRGAIGTGIALGKGPRQTAQLVRKEAGLPLSKALLITRTETTRAFREATRLQYGSNSQVVKGYKRLAARSDRTCPACIALDGERYELDEPLNEHPNGRCSMVPDVLDYADLGLDIPRVPEPPNARDWLAQQPELVQRNILGDTRFRAYEAGELDLGDLVEIKTSPVWGDSAVVANIDKIMVGKTGPGLAQIPLKEWIEVDDILGKGAETKAAKEAVKKIAKLKSARPKKATPQPSIYDKAVNDLNDLDMPGPMLGQEINELFINENRKRISATEAGKDIIDAVLPWSSGSNKDFRRDAEKWVKGEIPAGFSKRKGAILAEAASVAPRVPVPLHRGISFHLKAGQTIDDVEGLYKQRSTFDQPISSFSTSFDKAVTFSKPQSFDQDIGVMFNLEPGARGLNIEGISSHMDEFERIVSGRFEVIGTRRVTKPVGGVTTREELHIDIRQIATLVKE